MKSYAIAIAAAGLSNAECHIYNFLVVVVVVAVCYQLYNDEKEVKTRNQIILSFVI